MPSERGFSYFYQKLYSEDHERSLEVVRPLIIPRHEYYRLPTHAPGMEYHVGFYGVDPLPGDYELWLARPFDEVSSSALREASPREILDYLRRNPDLPAPGGWDGDPGHFYAVLQLWMEILCDEDEDWSFVN